MSTPSAPPGSAGRHVLPEFTHRTERGARTTDPYSRLLDARVVVLGGPLDERSAGEVVAQLLVLDGDADGPGLSLYLNSPGGCFQAMAAVHDTIRQLRSEVETVCVGQVGPEAAVLLAAGTPGRRLALTHSRIVLRQPTLADPFEGRPADVAVRAAEALRQRAVMTDLLAELTGQDRGRVAADLDRARVLDAAAALDYGLVDSLVTERPMAPGPEGRR
ncbi:ATP-dependent Clp protease proteolytic subunit [Streptomyces alkaliterrae]|uniref:ATP-dependent Clp protease proteolytic subunit n=1 Tax=Streptomyces alkaliterrae TaxID=2213162 RepID=A0A5P0YN02_9ACTN|nr:ATP-dependent Clp protease proteolytic subunit [Streptomyces alkaliterrae]MBB1252968.1 ATP-dependent Clp protease proteolytic subunit [Streptomyces alkaliterrae]MBB1257317.1 ATP-dependent Clp protease proteolytic subunit [Streptomyces alkaliterrae]MQS01057.1 ATP-dependent Clp protease proteolytic subunit [Streptomyces alkaliterrae]